MHRSLAILLVVLVGCAPSPEAEYDAALRALNRQQERLDALRPAYDAARQTAALAVCKEIAGATPEESATAALEQLQGIMGQAGDAQAPAGQATDKKQASDIDAVIDNLIVAQETFQEQQAALSAPLAMTNEVMSKIKTPGTPEAKRFEEVLAEMPEVKAYKRQEERLARAQKAAAAAEAALDGAATN
jgi:hypothetical protein